MKTHPPDDDAYKKSNCHAGVFNSGHNRIPGLGLANEINPCLSLRKSSVAERIEERPIYAGIDLPYQFHPAHPAYLQLHDTIGLRS
ncbi:hypothetical protein MES5069_440010 [Mesorhizobium escarrei]|uniref:Uncharacterized protein n=1 Tax=Mesorhizobium escarrei TaxID=666018 RepID=A0ABM9E691_9HYPH|nr:hypothetical protein MES5069_440010 [Mesorhizobium escarrei]